MDSISVLTFKIYMQIFSDSELENYIITQQKLLRENQSVIQFSLVTQSCLTV